jgi:hypothetical protein
MVRRGAVLALGQAGISEGLLVRLRDDGSLAVRVAAARAAGQIKLQAAGQDLVAMLLSNAETASHVAADSLIAINDPDIMPQIATSLDRILGQYRGKAKDERRAALLKQATACCRVLGQTRSKQYLDRLNAVLPGMALDDPMAIPLAGLAGQIGDDKTAQILADRIARGARMAASILAGAQGVPYQDRVAGEYVRAAGLLGRPVAAEAIDTLARVRRAEEGLAEPVSAALVALRQLEDAGSDRARLDALVLYILEHTSYTEQQAYHAAILAGERKVVSARALLETIVSQRRRHPQEMQAAAWALEQITGTRPVVGDPKPDESELWMIRRINPVR